ncbi:uncharacterized protein HMPREF1541_06611 [Cyphellophora europaea CBS 101466]|uniref:Uncharacterized protein n=1 Tax=Cyphellophora europaea (strain CBS 101466) TaxID=1220924 RepID=W2RS82_CYPE1|nr:uncharacterized protein HMPREF1541_06611 [Cyphellophora europaea CBS 101466]ETN38574.1 hypothetical protein HMPREF1541_06611 [Cyphellophora europaea CBS 101466]
MALTALVLCGKMPAHIQGLSKLLAPDGYDIIHVCSTLPSALSELPALLGDQTPPPTPSSGYGSNLTSATPIPGTAVRAILVGGGYSPDDFAQIKNACDAVRPLPYFRADISKPRPDGAAPTGPPAPEELRRRVLEAMAGAEREGQGWKAGVYLF